MHQMTDSELAVAMLDHANTLMEQIFGLPKQLLAQPYLPAGDGTCNPDEEGDSP